MTLYLISKSFSIVSKSGKEQVKELGEAACWRLENVYSLNIDREPLLKNLAFYVNETLPYRQNFLRNQ